jgi:hypothetical protein
MLGFPTDGGGLGLRGGVAERVDLWLPGALLLGQLDRLQRIGEVAGSSGGHAVVDVAAALVPRPADDVAVAVVLDGELVKVRHSPLHLDP